MFDADTDVTGPVEMSLAVVALMLSNTIFGIATLILTWTICRSRRKDSTGNVNTCVVLIRCVSAAESDLHT